MDLKIAKEIIRKYLDDHIDDDVIILGKDHPYGLGMEFTIGDIYKARDILIEEGVFR